MQLIDCCPSIPRLINYTEAMKACRDCKSKPKTEAGCCAIDCILGNANLLNSTGFVDIELVKEKLKEVVDKDSTWADVIDTVVNDCNEAG